MMRREKFKIRQLGTTLKLLLIILVGRREPLLTLLTFKFLTFSFHALQNWPTLHLSAHTATVFATTFYTNIMFLFPFVKNLSIYMQLQYIFGHLFLLALTTVISA